MYRLKLQCICGNQSDWKEYDVTKDQMLKIFNAARIALFMPQHLVCPKCNGLKTVKPIVESFTK